jgi:hypothetical protein
MKTVIEMPVPLGDRCIGSLGKFDFQTFCETLKAKLQKANGPGKELNVLEIHRLVDLSLAAASETEEGRKFFLARAHSKNL